MWSLLLLFIVCDSKLNIIGFWTVGEDIEIVISFFHYFYDTFEPLIY